MSPKEMQARSKEKVDQVLNLMKVLHIRSEAVQRIDPQTTIIRTEIMWIDDEKYPQLERTSAPEAEPTTEEAAGEKAEAPVEEVKTENV